MEIAIKKLTDQKYSINGKLVRQDMEGNWIGDPSMTTQEVSAFQQHIVAENASRAYHQHPPIQNQV